MFSIFCLFYFLFPDLSFCCCWEKRIRLHSLTYSPLFHSFLFLSTFSVQKKPSRGVLRKMCFENMQPIYRRTPLAEVWFKQSCSSIRLVAPNWFLLNSLQIPKLLESWFSKNQFFQESGFLGSDSWTGVHSAGLGFRSSQNV